MQVNSAAPVIWMMISIIFVRCIYLKGLATPQYYPMFQMMFNLIELTYVDDADLNMLNADGNSTL